jgi:intracellular septation protein
MDQPGRSVAAEEAFRQAAALHIQGKLKQAEKLYRAILNGDAGHLGALNNLGILCFQLGDYNSALAFTRDIIRRRPDSPTAYNTLAIIAKLAGRFVQAESYCREALRLAPAYAAAHNTLGDTLAALGRFAEAEACCREALRLIPNYAAAHNSLGIVLLSLGKLEEAEISFRETLRLEPGNAVALHNVFTTLNLQQQIGEVATWLGRSITLKSDFLSAIFFLLAYLTFGNVRFAGVCLIAARLAQLGGIKLTGRRIQQMQCMRFALVLVLGGATVLTQNPNFIMVQPSAFHFAVAGLMLWRGGMIRYITPAARQRVPEAVTVAAGYAWAALVAALGLTNLIIVLYFDLTTWAWFIAVGAIGAKTLQYVMFRMIVRRRIVQFRWITLGDHQNDHQIDERHEARQPQTF